MKTRLVVLSDLWGFENSLWIKKYEEILTSDYDLVYYDSRELAGIDKNIVNEKEIHLRYINGGICNAVDKLRESEKNEIDILSFSIGGTIGWKATMKGLKTNNLFAISSTRLRKETQKPNCNIHLTFGGNDIHRPSKDWAEMIGLTMNIIKDGGHNIYTQPNVIKSICEEFKNTRTMS